MVQFSRETQHLLSTRSSRCVTLLLIAYVNAGAVGLLEKFLRLQTFK